MGDSVARIESAKPVKSLRENLRYGEDLMEALDTADEFKYKVEQYAMQLADYEVGFEPRVCLIDYGKGGRYTTQEAGAEPGAIRGDDNIRLHFEPHQNDSKS